MHQKLPHSSSFCKASNPSVFPLTPEDWSLIMRHSHHLFHNAGTVLIEDGSNPPGIFQIASGQVRVVLSLFLSFSLSLSLSLSLCLSVCACLVHILCCVVCMLLCEKKNV
jgi:hypothetical protein